VNVNVKEPAGLTLNQSTGRFDWTRSATVDAVNNNYSTAVIGYGASFKTFCIDLAQGIGFGGTYTYVTDTLDHVLDGPSTPFLAGAKANAIRVLYAQSYGNVTNNVNGAAFQLAVWEIMKDGLSPAGGAAAALADTSSVFYANTTGMSGAALADASSALAQAASYISNVRNLLNANPSAYAMVASLVNLDAFKSDSAQDQVFLVVNNNTPMVPLPGSIAAVLPVMMLGGKALKTKRRRQQAEDSAVA